MKVLKYKDPTEDYTAKLEKMLEQCLTENQNAKMILKEA